MKRAPTSIVADAAGRERFRNLGLLETPEIGVVLGDLGLLASTWAD